MKTSLLLSAVAVCGLAAVASGDVVFDFGPSTGANGGCWANSTSGQNFAEQVTLGSNASVTGINIYTCISAPSGTSHIKFLYDDGAGNPGAVMTEWDQSADSWTLEGSEYVAYYEFAPVDLSAGVTYWVGVSGNGWEHGQSSVMTPGDGTMAQFSGSVFSFHASVGDQMFQLLGGAGGGFTLDIVGDCNTSFDVNVTGGAAGAKCAFAWGANAGSTPVPPCPGLTVDIKGADAWRSYPNDVLFIHLDGSGNFSFNKAGGPAFCGKLVQVVDLDNCVTSNVDVVP